jgi:hypothetical protein
VQRRNRASAQIAPNPDQSSIAGEGDFLPDTAGAGGEVGARAGDDGTTLGAAGTLGAATGAGSDRIDGISAGRSSVPRGGFASCVANPGDRGRSGAGGLPEDHAWTWPGGGGGPFRSASIGPPGGPIASGGIP